MKSSRNGSNGHVARVDVHDAAAHYQLSRTFTEISQTVVSSVVSTPCRLTATVGRIVECIIAVEKIQFVAAHYDLPDTQAQRSARKGKLDLQPTIFRQHNRLHRECARLIVRI